MYAKSEAFGYLTIGNNDFRITRPGYFLRKYKLDELPQLFNVLIGNMSFVGPRPEVKKYVSLYSQEERNILRFKPGITDYASIVYRHENEILKDSKDPEAEYIQHIMPHKLRLNLEYLHSRSLRKYFSIIFKTMVALFQ
jgi:lipopolysaccharide/colanic/teichoic acid biosynthesis glycosyltransferase